MTGSKARRGVVYLVGAGPGDPGLITVRGATLLDSCDVIIYDALANPELVRRATDRGAIAVDVGKRGGSSESAKQDEINAALIAHGRDGKRVVRLKGGDPLVFGRGSEEAQALAAAGIDFEIVPGVTAGIAAPAYAGIPVTHRGVSTSVTFVSGHEDPRKPETQIDWNGLARIGQSGTVVLYMGVKTLPSIAAALKAGGLATDTPAAAIQWGTHANQRTVVATLGTLAERAKAEGLTAPVITIIGATVGLRKEIAWFEARPLFGKRIVVTRAAAGGGPFAQGLRELGADVLEAPTTRIEALPTVAIDASVKQLGSYQWLIFTSQTAVRLFWEALQRAKLDARALHGIRVAVIGPVTREALAERGITADVIPERFVAEGLLDSLAKDGSVGTARVLYATAAGSRDVLPDGLREMGATVDIVAMYQSVPDLAVGSQLNEAIDTGAVDLVAFASGSAVDGYVNLVGTERARRVLGASIGPVTSDAARKHSIDVVAQGRESTTASLAQAIVEYFART